MRDRDTHGHQKVQKYAGRPTEEKDKAWDRLIKREPLSALRPQIGINAISAAYFNATLRDLERAGESLDDVTELTGGGYLASIGVFHELHCVVSTLPLGAKEAYRLMEVCSANFAFTSTKNDITRIYRIPTLDTFRFILVRA